jgi:hypothetical protein
MEDVKSLTVDKQVAKLKLLARFLLSYDSENMDFEPAEIFGLGVSLHETARILENWNRTQQADQKGELCRLEVLSKKPPEKE